MYPWLTLFEYSSRRLPKIWDQHPYSFSTDNGSELQYQTLLNSTAPSFSGHYDCAGLVQTQGYLIPGSDSLGTWQLTLLINPSVDTQIHEHSLEVLLLPFHVSDDGSIIFSSISAFMGVWVKTTCDSCPSRPVISLNVALNMSRSARSIVKMSLSVAASGCGGLSSLILAARTSLSDSGRFFPFNACAGSMTTLGWRFRNHSSQRLPGTPSLKGVSRPWQTSATFLRNM